MTFNNFSCLIFCAKMCWYPKPKNTPVGKNVLIPQVVYYLLQHRKTGNVLLLHNPPIRIYINRTKNIIQTMKLSDPTEKKMIKDKNDKNVDTLVDFKNFFIYWRWFTDQISKPER